MDDGLTHTFLVTIRGNPLDVDQTNRLRRVVIERSWSAADRTVIEFDADDFAFPGKITDELVVELVEAQQPQSPALFTGTITGVQLRVTSGRARVVVEALDHRHRLTRKIEPTTYQEIRLDEVVSEIAKAHRFRSSSSFGSTKYPHFIIADSHFAVLQQIARRTGTVWRLVDDEIIFDTPDSSRTPSVAIQVGAIKELDEVQAIDLEVRFSPTERADKVSVNSWDQLQGKAIVGSATTDRLQQLELDPTPAPADAVAWAGGAFDVQDANEMASGIGRRLRAAEVTGFGTIRANHLMAPGAVIELRGVGDDFAGKYVLSSVTHRFGDLDESATTEFRIGPDDSSLDQLLGSGARTGGHAPAGVTIGIVTETADPDHKGRVRVKLPMISDQLQTGWIRLASLGGGRDRGIVFVPEVNDEVLVAFEHGELNRPYVIGTLWNDPGTAFDDTTNVNKTEERRLVSRLGHRIRFVDIKEDDDASGVKVELGDGKTSLFLGYQQVTIATEGRPLELKNGKASIKLDNDDITISANNIKLNAEGKVEVTSNSDTSIDAKGKVDLKAATQLSAKSNAGTTVESSAITVVKGSLVQVN